MLYAFNNADIFTVDNSASMSQEASALGQNFNVFINRLASLWFWRWCQWFGRCRRWFCGWCFTTRCLHWLSTGNYHYFCRLHRCWCQRFRTRRSRSIDRWSNRATSQQSWHCNQFRAENLLCDATFGMNNCCNLKIKIQTMTAMVVQSPIHISSILRLPMRHQRRNPSGQGKKNHWKQLCWRYVVPKNHLKSATP